MEQGLTGWLSPEGEFYPCKYGEHYQFATKVLSEDAKLNQDRFPMEYEKGTAITGSEALKELYWVAMGVDYIHIPSLGFTRPQAEWINRNLIDLSDPQRGMLYQFIEDMNTEIETAVDAGYNDKKKFKVITLCGSTKFQQEFEDANERLTMEGNVVISVGVFGHSKGIVLSEEQKEELDAIHFQKIDMADEIFVINVGGYVGSSTKREIAYAEQTGKLVNHLEPLTVTNDNSDDGLKTRVLSENELEAEKLFLEDVRYYMEQNNCDKETAIKSLDKIYADYSKKRREKFHGLTDKGME